MSATSQAKISSENTSECPHCKAPVRVMIGTLMEHSLGQSRRFASIALCPGSNMRPPVKLP